MTDDALDLKTILSRAKRLGTINIRRLKWGILLLIGLLILLRQRNLCARFQQYW